MAKKTIEISFEPGFMPSTGAAAFMSWHGSGRGELDRIFAVKRGERIVGIIVNEHGITAHFKTERESDGSR